MRESRKRIAAVTIGRMSIYARALQKLQNSGVELLSSEELGDRIGCSGAQIRKDLSCFGEFGESGKGYYVKDLKEAIFRILGLDKCWNVALVGAGQLGSALLAYPGFHERGFDIIAVFDNDIRKIGKKWENVVIQDISELIDTIKEREIKIGIITVPPQISQEIADMLVSGGIRAILNFAPARLIVPDGVELRNADLTTEFECLSYFLTHNAKPGNKSSRNEKKNPSKKK